MQFWVFGSRWAGWLLFGAMAWGQASESALPLPAECTAPALSPDGRWYLCLSAPKAGEGGLLVVPVSGGRARMVAAHAPEADGYVVAASWAPDSRRVVFSRQNSRWSGKAFVQAVDGGVAQPLVSLGAPAPEADWNADGRHVVACWHSETSTAANCQPRILTAEGKVTATLTARAGGPVAFSPDGRTLAYADGNVLFLQKLSAQARPLGAPLRIWAGRRDIEELRWLPEGKELLVRLNSESGAYLLLRAVRGAEARPTAGLPANFAVSQILADGAVLGSLGDEKSQQWSLRLDVEGARPEPLPASQATPPDSRFQIDLTLGYTRIFAAGRPVVEHLPNTLGVASRLQWAGVSPDGRWLGFATGPADGHIQFQDALFVVPMAGGPIRTLLRGAEGLWDLAWAPDGRSLVTSMRLPATGGGAGPEEPLVRIPVQGDGQQMLVRQGVGPRFTSDGRWLYFRGKARTGYDLCRMPAGGGEVRCLPGPPEVSYVRLEPVQSGMVALAEEQAGEPRPFRFRMIGEEMTIRELGSVPFRPRALTATRGGTRLEFEQEGRSSLRALRISNWR